MALPLTIPRPNEDERQAILKLLREENDHISHLKEMLEALRKNNLRMIKLYNRRLAAWELPVQQGPNPNDWEDGN